MKKEIKRLIKKKQKNLLVFLLSCLYMPGFIYTYKESKKKQAALKKATFKLINIQVEKASPKVLNINLLSPNFSMNENTKQYINVLEYI
jgi:hypothetical protein